MERLVSEVGQGRRIARFPELGTEPLPVEPHVSEEFFERERERLFRKVWLNVGRVEEVPEPGRYIVRDVAVLRTSVIIVRGKDGVIRGFHNMCTHRGNKVAKDCAGKRGAFVCGFHGWTYDLQGKLIHVTDEEEFYDLKKEELGLRPVATDVWEGFIFIHSDPNPAESLLEYMGEMVGRLHGFPFNDMPLVEQWSAEVNANWKTFTEAFLEGYHAEYLHKNTYPEFSRNKSWNKVNIHLLRRHAFYGLTAKHEHRPGPVEALALKAGFSLVYSGETNQGQELPPGVNPERSPNWSFDANVIFPNFLLVIGSGWYATIAFLPVDVNHSSYDYRYYASRPRTAGVRVAQEYGKLLLRDAAREDLSTIEDTHAMQCSGAMTHMPISDQEAVIRQWWNGILGYVA